MIAQVEDRQLHRFQHEFGTSITRKGVDQSYRKELMGIKATKFTAWAILPLSEWGAKLDIPVDMLTAGDRLLDPDYDGRPTALCRKLSRGEVMLLAVKGATIADRTANPKAIA